MNNAGSGGGDAADDTPVESKVVEEAGTAPSTADDPKTLRLWPAVLIVAVQLFLMFGTRLVTDNAFISFMSQFLGPIAATLLLLVWWVFFSRVPWKQRGVGLLAFAAAGAVSFLCLHGSMKYSYLMYVLPTATTAAVVSLLLCTALPWSWRRWIGLTAGTVALLVWTAARLDGVDGAFLPELSCRWSPTAEERFLEEAAARRANEKVSDAAGVVLTGRQPGDWPGFRGPNRDGRLTGVRINTDFDNGGPPEMWRRRVGPGWSSFAVIGDLVFTQEQRGEQEAVVCYDGRTGSEMWQHVDQARFTEVVSGSGPRATPTFDGGRIYAMGAAGVVNCLEAATGELVWSRKLVEDTGATVPMWGFSSSPLVAQGVAIVFAGGGDGQCLIAYDTQTGEVSWTGGNGKKSYSSAQLVTFSDRRQVLIASDLGLESFAPAAGDWLWTYEWPVPSHARIVQPAPIGGNSVMLGTGSGNGTRHIEVAKSNELWTTNQAWETNDLKPYFNDFVVHQGHAYGFDGSIFCCVDVESGQRRWKGGRYGSGQVLLIQDQDLLLVLSEKGEVVLLDTNPEQLDERNRFRAIEGKTWNHPVVAHGHLYVRNGVEMACFRVVSDSDDGSRVASGRGKAAPR